MKFLPDVYIQTEHLRGPQSGKFVIYNRIFSGCLKFLWFMFCNWAAITGSSGSTCKYFVLWALYCNVDILLFRSPGFGLTLVAETKNDSFLCAEQCSNVKTGPDFVPSIPEEIGKKTAHLLLEEIYRVSDTTISTRTVQLLLTRICAMTTRYTVVWPHIFTTVRVIL